MMDTVHNPEPEALAQIERLNLEAMATQKKIQQAESEQVHRELDGKLELIQRAIRALQHRSN